MENRVIRDFIKKYWIHYAAGAVFLILSSYVQTLAPKVLGSIIDLLRDVTVDQSQVTRNIGLLVLLAFLAFITRFVWRYFIIGNGRNLECYLRQRLFEHFQRMSPQFYVQRKTGDLMAYAINDISAVRMTFGPGIALIVHGVGLGLISVLSMVRFVNLRLTIFALLPIPFIFIMMIKIGQMVQARFRLVQETFASISDRVQENISGIRVIKSYVQEDREVENFQGLNDQMKQANIKMVRVSALLSPLIETCFGISFMISLIYGSGLVRAGTISLGDFVAFNGYLTMIMMPVVSVGRVINIFQKGMASLKRLDEIFSIPPQVVDRENAQSANNIKGDIEIKDLSFSYPDTEEYPLKNIDLRVEAGQVLGIIGKTGSGKTTLVNLLLKLYNVPDNKIFIDGKDINQYAIKSLRENMGYVPQDNFLFSAPIEDNIKFFRDIYSDGDIENASKMSVIYDNIMDFPKQFKTLVGERGVNLSGGQKQRISIARAIIKNPKILILDDSLSAVDTKTEEMILKNIKDVMETRTGIIIAHRISALKHADQIIVMDKGEIVERGTHQQLIEKEGLYHEIYKQQFEEQNREKVDQYEAS